MYVQETSKPLGILNLTIVIIGIGCITITFLMVIVADDESNCLKHVVFKLFPLLRTDFIDQQVETAL